MIPNVFGIKEFMSKCHQQNKTCFGMLGQEEDLEDHGKFLFLIDHQKFLKREITVRVMKMEL